MSKLWVEDIATLPSAAYQTTAPAEGGPWLDKSNDIESWCSSGMTTGLDYKAVRTKMLVLAATATSNFTDMTQLTADEKRCCAENFALPMAEIVAELGAEFDDYLDDWIEQSKVARFIRWEKSKTLAFNAYGEQVAKIELKGIEEDGLGPAYFEGIEGTLEDNVEGLFDRIESRVGTNYETTGWKAQDHPTINGQTNQEAIDDIMNQLKNGDL